MAQENGLLKKDIRILKRLVGEQIDYKFEGLPKIPKDQMAQAKQEMEGLYDLNTKLKNMQRSAPQEDFENVATEELAGA